MFAFIRRHWVAYLVGAVLAIALGAGAAVFVGAKASTPQEVKSERAAAEEQNERFTDELEESLSS